MARAEVVATPLTVAADGVLLKGDLTLPAGARGLVVFAHGSGSSRFSPRNRYVAQVLFGGGLATLLFDLLSAEEEAEDERTARLRFDIGLLARRLVSMTDWLVAQADTKGLAIGYFGASTGAAAALVAAAERPDVVRAVVSRGGRPDLAGEGLRCVQAPTLLVVGGDDQTVLRLNQQALALLPGVKRLEVVPGATHLFEEPGALEKVAELALWWCREHLAGSSADAVPGRPQAQGRPRFKT